MECLSSCCENYDLTISTTKTEVMSVEYTFGNLSISVSGKCLHWTAEYKYFGSIFSENWKMNREIGARIQRANAVTYHLSPTLQHCNIPMDTKAKLINSVFLPMLTFQCQTWTLNRDLERKVTTCEMKCLRRATGKTRWDKIRNKEITAMIRISTIMNYIAQQQIKWFGHLMKTSPSQSALWAYNNGCSANSTRGRPQQQWIDGVSGILCTYGMTLYQTSWLALDCKLHFPMTPHGISRCTN